MVIRTDELHGMAGIRGRTQLKVTWPRGARLLILARTMSPVLISRIVLIMVRMAVPILIGTSPKMTLKTT